MVGFPLAALAVAVDATVVVLECDVRGVYHHTDQKRVQLIPRLVGTKSIKLSYLIGPIKDAASNRSASLPDCISTNPEQVTSLEQYRSLQYHACIHMYTEYSSR